MTGAAVIAVGYGLGHRADGRAIWQLILIGAVIGAGIGLAYGAMPALIMGAVPLSETASANGLNTPDALGRHLDLQRGHGRGPGPHDDALRPIALPSQAGFRTAMAIGGAAALAAVLVAGLIPGRRATPPADPSAGRTDEVGEPVH